MARFGKLIELLAVVLPFVGSIYLAVRPPKRWSMGVIVFGLVTSVFIYVQIDRSDKAREAELRASEDRLEQTNEALKSLTALVHGDLAARGSDASSLADAVRAALKQIQSNPGPQKSSPASTAQTQVPSPPSQVPQAPLFTASPPTNLKAEVR